MIISIRVTEREKDIITQYSKLNGITVSEAMKQAFFEKLEDDYDVLMLEEAVSDYAKDSQTYSLDEVKDILGIK